MNPHNKTMIGKERTPEEDAELESLVERSWNGEELTIEEKIRANILCGHDQEWAEWIAVHGYPKE